MKTYDLAQVAKLTGLTKGQLRAWEHRYGWPKPPRSANNYRRYPEGLVAQLRLVRDLIRRTGKSPREFVVDGQLMLPTTEDQQREKLLRLRREKAAYESCLAMPEQDFWSETGRQARAQALRGGLEVAYDQTIPADPVRLADELAELQTVTMDLRYRVLNPQRELGRRSITVVGQLPTGRKSA